MIRDVSDLVAAREAVRSAASTARAAQRELATLVSHAPIGMALVGLDGTWLVVNPALARLTGYSEPELLAGTFQATEAHEKAATSMLDELAKWAEALRPLRQQ